MKVCQDTRLIKRGEWFVAVQGERCDGHLFIEEALDKGAAGVLEVEELYELAMKKIGRLKPKVIAITGSYGKTTTKEAIYKVLSSKFKTLRTSGNLNTPLGVAIEIINNLKPRHQAFVVEVGMNQLGEIRKSATLINPQVGVLTSVGEMHLEKLKSINNIKKAKAELLEALPPGGVAVLNYDDINVRGIAKRFNGRKVWYGFSSKADVNHSYLKDLQLNLLGERNKYSVLAAYAVGRIFKIPKEKIFKALESLKPQKGRLNLLSGKNGLKIIDDTYNAGPQSTGAALEALWKFPAQRRIVVLGDMLELGRLEEKAHLKVIKMAFGVADRCVLVGPRYSKAIKAVKVVKPTEIVKDSKKAVEAVEKLDLGNGDVILVKGSQGVRMEKVVKALLKDKAKASRLLVRQDERWIC